MNDDDDDDGGFFMDDVDDLDALDHPNLQRLSLPPPTRSIPPLTSLTLVPMAPIVASTSSKNQLPPIEKPQHQPHVFHPTDGKSKIRRDLAFGVPLIPTTTIAKLKPCTCKLLAYL